MRNKIILFLFLFSSLVAAQEKSVSKPLKRIIANVDYGVKAGFNSSAIFIHDFMVNGENIEKHPYKYKTGFSMAAFMRINMGDYFVQPELNYITTNEEVHFSLPYNKTPDNKDYAYSSLSTKRQSIDIPILFGYHIINHKPWRLSVLGGPQFKLNLKNEYGVEVDNLGMDNIEEIVNPFNLSFTLGVEVTINHVFFDYRYEIGLFNINKEYKLSNQENNIILKRNINIMSFSVGYIF